MFIIKSQTCDKFPYFRGFRSFLLIFHLRETILQFKSKKFFTYFEIFDWYGILANY